MTRTAIPDDVAGVPTGESAAEDEPLPYDLKSIREYLNCELHKSDVVKKVFTDRVNFLLSKETLKIHKKGFIPALQDQLQCFVFI